MQCPETPRLDLQQDPLVPLGISPLTGTITRRAIAAGHLTPAVTTGRSLENDNPSSCYRFSGDQIFYKQPQATASFTTRNPFESPDLWQLSSGNPPVPPVPDTGVLQFHKVAQRLALSSLSSNVPSQSQEEDVFGGRSQHADGTFRGSSLRISNSFCDNQIECRPWMERDITSARKEFHYMRHRSQTTVPTPHLASNVIADGSPRPYDQEQIGCSRRRKAQTTRNFSRPIALSSPQTHLAQPQRCNFSKPMRMGTCVPSRLLNDSDSSRHDLSITTNSDDVSRRGVNDHGSTTVQDERRQKGGNLIEQACYPAAPHFANLVEELGEPKRGFSESILAHDSIRESLDSAVSDCLGDKRLQLSSWEIWLQRIFFSIFIFGANIGLGLAYLGSFKHPYLLATLVFMKSKDILSTIADILGILHSLIRLSIWSPKYPSPRWILSLVCAYAETEEQILKTVYSLARSKPYPHKQVICVVLDGKPRDIVGKLSMVTISVQRPYTTWRGTRGEIVVHAGYLEDVPLILVQKAKNAGKKDSLILGHDLFNFPREDMPHSTQMLRKEIWRTVLPTVTTEACEDLDKFDFVFCTDADSTIHDFALRKLADALCKEDNAIAGCGVLFAEFGSKKTEYSPWHLFQQFQYTFGQYVRRQAESTWGRVTCLPGCITMIVVRPEMGRAISEYAKPVTERNLFRHQVQYLGTDRRLTWCMMSQGKHLRTVFVPNAISETVVPDSISHYLSQRRRWASNAYFNDFFYFFGPRQRLVTRLFAAIDIVRLTLVYYRVFNTGYFLHGLITNFYVIKIIPTLIVTKTPATWYLLLVVAREPILRRRLHKILLGMCINQVISPVLSVIVFTNVLFHMGSQAWGKTGASTQSFSAVPVPVVYDDTPPAQIWTPIRLAESIQKAIRGMTPVRRPQRSDKLSSRALSTQSSCGEATTTTTPPWVRCDVPLSNKPAIGSWVTGNPMSGTQDAETTIRQDSDQPSTMYTPTVKSRRVCSPESINLTKRAARHRARATPRPNAVQETLITRTYDTTWGSNFEE